MSAVLLVLRQKLDAARIEEREAARTVRMIGHALTDPLTPEEFAQRLDVELQTAERRLELWQSVVVELTARLNAVLS